MVRGSSWSITKSPLLLLVYCYGRWTDWNQYKEARHCLQENIARRWMQRRAPQVHQNQRPPRLIWRNHISHHSQIRREEEFSTPCNYTRHHVGCHVPSNCLSYSYGIRDANPRLRSTNPSHYALQPQLALLSNCGSSYFFWTLGASSLDAHSISGGSSSPVWFIRVHSLGAFL